MNRLIVTLILTALLMAVRLGADAPTVAELAEMAHSHGLLLFEDAGSGALPVRFVASRRNARATFRKRRRLRRGGSLNATRCGATIPLAAGLL